MFHELECLFVEWSGLTLCMCVFQSFKNGSADFLMVWPFSGRLVSCTVVPDYDDDDDRSMILLRSLCSIATEDKSQIMVLKRLASRMNC